MPRLRGHRDEDGGTNYQMREKFFSVGDDFWIETDDGERVFKVDGKALRVRDTLVLKGASARRSSRSRREAERTDKMKIERDGTPVRRSKRPSSARSAIASRSTSRAATTWRPRATSSTTSTRSSATATRWPRSRSAGFAFVTPTASRLRRPG